MHTATLWRAHRRDRLAGPGLAVFHGRVVVTDLEEVGEHKAREGVGHQDGKAPTGAVQRERQTQVDADPGGEGKLAHGPAVGAILEKVVQREEKRDHTERERGVKPLQRVKGMPRLLVMVSQEGVHGRHIVVQHHVVRVDVVRAVVLLPPERRPDSPHVLQNLQDHARTSRNNSQRVTNHDQRRPSRARPRAGTFGCCRQLLTCHQAQGYASHPPGRGGR
eukprot:scaffold311_cov405-Prasinococcus_capsulatus_cf.AAC.3